MKGRTLKLVTYALFALLAAGLAYTQIARFFYYSRLARNNIIRIIPIDGPRGNIYDRNGVVMVSNRLSFNVAVIYQELRNRERLAALLTDTLGLSRREIVGALEKASRKPFAPVTIAEDIGKEKAIAIEEESSDIGGLVIETKSKRHYIYGQTCSHVFGYLSEVNEEELPALREYGYRMRDLVGRSGLEKYYDRYLAGKDGGIQIMVDNRGRQVRVLSMREPSNGADLHLTIDIRLQELCDKLLTGKRGAIIIMDPETGEVLALASQPAFDPNIFVMPGTDKERTGLIKDTARHPLLNRAISGRYEPGSVFKVVIASGALETKKISADTHFFCGGSYMVGSRKFDCWKEKGHGSQEVTDGLMNSCNVFFYNTGRALGVDNIEYYSKLFGFGKVTGIDLPDETAGLVPGRLWKRIYRNDNWYEGETINYSIGQGYLLVTPMQVADMMAVMANRGSLVRPFIVRKAGSADIARVERKNTGLRESTIRKVREGLYKVVNGENGTGKRAKVTPLAAAGKTGTAQNPNGPTHAWFSGFAPYENPRLCLVVFLEHGGKGGLAPAEIARNIFAEAKKIGYV